MKNGIITPETARVFRASRGNPWAGMQPLSLTAAINAYDMGWLRQFCLIFERLELGADLTIAANVPKRRDAVAALPWEITIADDVQDKDRNKAELHREALLHFFNHLTVRSVVDLDEEGEVSLLVDNLMRATFLLYDVHEIIWQPRGADVTAELRHAPLALFESTTGALRYAGPSGGLGSGEALDRNHWLVTKRSGYGVALAAAAMLKSETLRDWLEYNTGFGLPGVHAETDAQPGDTDWRNLEAVLDAMVARIKVLTGTGIKFNLLETSGQGGAVFEPLYDKLERSQIIICNGSDLSTMSGHNRQGASLQGNDTAARIARDARFSEDSINRRLVRQIIEEVFGVGELPLAWFRLTPPMEQDDKLEMEKFDFLIQKKVPVSIAQLAERMGHSLPGAKEELVQGTGAEGQEVKTGQEPEKVKPGQEGEEQSVLRSKTAKDERAKSEEENAAEIANEARAPLSIHDAVVEDLKPLIDALKGALKSDDAALMEKLAALDLDVLAEDVLSGKALEAELLGALGQAFFDAVDVPGLLVEALGEVQSAAEEIANDAEFDERHPRDGLGRFRKKDEAERPLDKQLYSVKKLYKGTPLFMRAPDGTRSALTPDQWLHAHTAKFIRDHGDWEYLAHQQWLSQANPVAQLTGDEFAKIDGESLLDRVTHQWMEQHGGHASHPLLGSVLLDRRAVKDDMAHGLGRKKSASFAAVPDVIEAGRIIDYQTPSEQKPYESFTLAAPLTLAGERHTMVAVVHRDRTQRLYVHEVTAGPHVDAFKTGAVGEPSGAPRGDILTLLQRIHSVKPQDVRVKLNAHGEPEPDSIL